MTITTIITMIMAEATMAGTIPAAAMTEEAVITDPVEEIPEAATADPAEAIPEAAEQMWMWSGRMIFCKRYENKTILF